MFEKISDFGNGYVLEESARLQDQRVLFRLSLPDNVRATLQFAPKSHLKTGGYDTLLINYQHAQNEEHNADLTTFGFDITGKLAVKHSTVNGLGQSETLEITPEELEIVSPFYSTATEFENLRKKLKLRVDDTNMLELRAYNSKHIPFKDLTKRVLYERYR